MLRGGEFYSLDVLARLRSGLGLDCRDFNRERIYRV